MRRRLSNILHSRMQAHDKLSVCRIVTGSWVLALLLAKLSVQNIQSPLFSVHNHHCCQNGSFLNLTTKWGQTQLCTCWICATQHPSTRQYPLHASERLIMRSKKHHSQNSIVHISVSWVFQYLSELPSSEESPGDKPQTDQVKIKALQRSDNFVKCFICLLCFILVKPCAWPVYPELLKEPLKRVSATFTSDHLIIWCL